VAGEKRAIPRRALDLFLFALIFAAYAGLQVATAGRDEEQNLARGGVAFGFDLPTLWVGTDLLAAALPGPWGMEVGWQPTLEPRLAPLLVLAAGLLAWPLGSRAAGFGAGWMIAACAVYVPFIGAIEDRYLYQALLAVGLCLGGLFDLVRRGLAALIQERAGALVAELAVLTMVGLGLPLLAERTRAWAEAGDLVQRTLADAQRRAPRPEPGAVFVFTGLPDLIKGAHVFRNGLPEAIRLQYRDRTLTARHGTAEEARQQPKAIVIETRS
jgi:hypothetical protein